MKITIISVGKIKENYLKDAILEYKKRISKYSQVEEIVIEDLSFKDNSSEAYNEQIKKQEGIKIISQMPEKSYKIALDLKGVMLTSEELALKFIDINNYFSSNITFIIGGSLGLHQEVLSKCDYRLCFGKMTFPHQLMKVILLEQIYRAFKINNNETYHK